MKNEQSIVKQPTAKFGNNSPVQETNPKFSATAHLSYQQSQKTKTEQKKMKPKDLPEALELSIKRYDKNRLEDGYDKWTPEYTA